MAGDRKRISESDSFESAKRVKMEGQSGDKGSAKNPYLAHLEQEDEKNGNGNGAYYNSAIPQGSPLHKFIRRETTAKEASKAEDSDNNPFTGQPHSQQYFKILKGRRNLPVHKQRYVHQFCAYLAPQNV